MPLISFHPTACAAAPTARPPAVWLRALAAAAILQWAAVGCRNATLVSATTAQSGIMTPAAADTAPVRVPAESVGVFLTANAPSVAIFTAGAFPPASNEIGTTAPGDLAGLDIGSGYQHLVGVGKAACVAKGPMNALAIAPGETPAGGAVSYQISRAESRDILASLLDVDARASAGFGPFRASARVALYNRTNLMRNTVVYVVRSVVRLPSLELRNGDKALTEYGMSLVKRRWWKFESAASRARRFTDGCGTHFVVGVDRGASFFAVVKVTAATHQEASDLATRLNGSIGAGLFSTAAEMRKSLQSLSTQATLEVVIETDGKVQAAPGLDGLETAAASFALTTQQIGQEGAQQDKMQGPVYRRTGWRIANWGQLDAPPEVLQLVTASETPARTRMQNLAGWTMDTDQRVAEMAHVAARRDLYVLDGFDLAGAQQRLQQRRNALIAAYVECERNIVRCADRYQETDVAPALVELPSEKAVAYTPVVSDVNAVGGWSYAGEIPAGREGALTVRGEWSAYPPPRTVCRPRGLLGGGGCRTHDETWIGPTGYPWHSRVKSKLFRDQFGHLAQMVIEEREFDGTVKSRRLYQGEREIAFTGPGRIYLGFNDDGAYQDNRHNPDNPMKATLTIR